MPKVSRFREPWVITDKLTIGKTHLTEASAALVAVDGLTASVDELNTLAGVTAGTAAASGALVVDDGKNIGALGTVAAASFEGALVGPHRHPIEELTESGAISLTSGIVLLNHSTTPVEATLAAPTAGDELYLINSSAGGTAAHTVTCAAGVTFDGTNDMATLDAPGMALHLVAISATRWYIVSNNGTVTFDTSEE